jgi:hypothetical protein
MPGLASTPLAPHSNLLTINPLFVMEIKVYLRN